jgi:hypothetical protein
MSDGDETDRPFASGRVSHVKSKTTINVESAYNFVQETFTH